MFESALVSQLHPLTQERCSERLSYGMAKVACSRRRYQYSGDWLSNPLSGGVIETLC